MGARVVPIAAARQPGKEVRSVLVGAKVDPLTRRVVAVPVFVINRSNRCPDCHSEAFTVGRVTAECAGCGMPFAIVDLRRLS